VKDRINNYQESSSILIFDAIKHMIKEIEIMIYEITFMLTKVRNVRRANEILSKRRRAKKIRIRQEETLSIENAQDILAQKNIEQQLEQDKRKNNNREDTRLAIVRQYNNCNESSYNARTC